MAERRILVVRLGAMGDVIHTLPAVATLKHSFPHSRIVWAIDRKWAALLEGNPFVDEVLEFERSFTGFLALRRKLRESRFDLAVDFQGLIKSEHIVLEAKKETASEYLQILEAYLPRQVSPEEIIAWIKANIDFGRFKNKMQAMGVIMKHFGKTADGKLVNQILKDWA